ncbi:MAG: hypothetical protein PQJ58_01990 [Spirochaetales bacterium]|nr:hypothetical protein [Spirochaetales bacterium]
MRRAVLFLLLLASPVCLSADNTGVLKSRLIELPEGIYLFEVEVPSAQVSALGAPVFPDRFILKEKGRSEFQGQVTLRYTYGSSSPLEGKETLVLPWLINGTSLTVFRQDGSISQRLFLRNLEGIRIPLESFFHGSEDKKDILRQWFRSLTGNTDLLIPLILLALVLASYESFLLSGRFCLLFFMSQALAMISGELGFPGPDLLYAQILILGLAVFLASFREKPGLPALLLPGTLSGYLYGAALYQELSFLNYKTPVILSLHLLTTVYWSLFLSLLTLLLVLAVSLLIEKSLLAKVLKYASGVFAFFFIILLFQARVTAGDRDVLELSARSNRSRYDLPDPQQLQSGLNRSVKSLSDPVQAYLAVDPFELRIEVLLRLDELMGSRGMEKDTLLVSEQKEFLDSLLSEFLESLRVYADTELIHPLNRQADFVSYGSGGVTLKPVAVEENRDEGLVGLSLLYGTSENPGEILVDWNFFPSGVESLPGTASRLWGSEGVILTREDNLWVWTNPFQRSLFPDMTEVAVESSGFPVAALLFAGGALFLFLRGGLSGRRISIALIILSLISYLFYGSLFPVRLSSGMRKKLLPPPRLSCPICTGPLMFRMMNRSMTGSLSLFQENFCRMFIYRTGKPWFWKTKAAQEPEWIIWIYCPWRI